MPPSSTVQGFGHQTRHDVRYRWGPERATQAPHEVKVTAVVSGGMCTPFLLDRVPDIDLANLEDPRNVAETVRCILRLPADSVVPEITVIPMRETSWP